jgi:acyl-CoA synthetase (AMP-forming)/AMP-acid ligase II
MVLIIVDTPLDCAAKDTVCPNARNPLSRGSFKPPLLLSIWGCSPCKADEIRSFCHNQIAHFKVPHYIEFVTEIPMTVTGKPQKYLMREEMVRRLGLQEVKSA